MEASGGTGHFSFVDVHGGYTMLVLEQFVKLCNVLHALFFSMCIFSPRKVFKNMRASTVYSYVPGAFLPTVGAFREQTPLVRVTAGALWGVCWTRNMEGHSHVRPTDVAQGLVCAEREGGSLGACGLELI